MKFDITKIIGVSISIGGVIFALIGTWYSLKGDVARHDSKWEWFDSDFKPDIKRRIERLEQRDGNQR